ncbi:MAG: hypothetical protein ACOVLE_15930 [Pirellula staleyi]
MLKPEYTILVTATPDDKDLDDLKSRMQIKHIHRISVSRADATGNGFTEGLIKRGVKAIAWRVEEGLEALVDFEKTALKNATELHHFLKGQLQQARINLTPLMLVQVDSRGKSVERARDSLLELGFQESQIANGNQLQFLPEPPPGAHFQPAPAAILNAQGDVDVEQLPLFVGAFGGAEIAAKAVVIAAEDLPTAIESEAPLTASRLNVYKVYPPMNNWEIEFAQVLDSDDTDTVLWWHRNESRKPWSINVLMENGQNFYPDFIVGIRDRAREDNGLLADTKEAYQRTSELPKLGADHRTYGRVLILTKGNPKNVWEIAKWDTLYDKPAIDGRFLIREAREY